MLFRSIFAIASFAAHSVCAAFLLAIWHWLGTPVELTPYPVMSFESVMVAVAGIVGILHGYAFPGLGRTQLKNSVVRSAVAEAATCLWSLTAVGGVVLGFTTSPDAFGAAGICIAAGAGWYLLADWDNRTFERLLAQRGAAMFSLSV